MIIPGFSNYAIDTNGVVTNIVTGRVLKTRTAKVGNNVYKQINLTDDEGNTRVYNILALLALTYLGKPLHEGVAMAKDGDNLNTTLDNVVCTTRSAVTKRVWSDGKMANKHTRSRCYDADSIAMIYEAMKAYDAPVNMTTLSVDLQVPYSTVRYSILCLRSADKVRKTDAGFEVIR